MKSSDLQYLGAIRTPQNTTSKVTPNPEAYPAEGRLTDGMGLSGGPFCIDHARQEFIIGSRHSRIVRLKKVPPALPKYRTSGDLKLLDAASVPLAPYVDGVMVDISNITWGEINNPDAGTGATMEGIQVLGDHLAVTGQIYYDANVTQDRSAFMAEWPVTAVRQVIRSPWRSFKNFGEGVVAGPLCVIPERYRVALKGDIMSGQPGGKPIITTQLPGPCAISFQANDLHSVDDIAATLLLGYPAGMPGGAWGGPANDLYNNSTTINGAAFVGDVYAFAGNHGYGAACYGDGVADLAMAGPAKCFDPTAAAKGTHAYPYRVQLWVYRVADFIEVAAGRKKPHELVPQWFTLEFPVFERQHNKLPVGAMPRIEVCGMGYDSERCELHVCVKSQDSYGYEPGPLIHVWKVLGVAALPNPKPTPVGSAPVVVDPTLDVLKRENAVLKTELASATTALKFQQEALEDEQLAHTALKKKLAAQTTVVKRLVDGLEELKTMVNG